MAGSLNIFSVESLYNALNDQDAIKSKALLMLMLRNWLTKVSNFDPVSGHVLPSGIIDFLDAVAKSIQTESAEEIKDRIYRIVSYIKEAVLTIIGQPRDKILREHVMLPIYAAREIDSNSVRWLSRQPGRTLREKLSGRPYIKAVRRRPSVNTPENQLLKAFLLRLEQILIERQNALSTTAEKTCEELLVSLQRWLRSEDATEVDVWRNLSPNNTLLQDKHYRKVWSGWLWLQEIDESIAKDCREIDCHSLKCLYWYTLSLLYCSDRFRIVQQPLDFNYDNFSIVRKLPICGYLFPTSDSKVKGKIKFIKPDKSFGFITADDQRELYFNRRNLTRKLDINSLSAGDEVSFVIGSNQQGECANAITLPVEIIPVDFNFSDDKWDIQVGKDKYSLKIVSDNLVIQQDQRVKQEIKIEPATLNQIPQRLLSLVMGSSFQYSELAHNQDEQMRMESSIVDLCSIRPAFINQSGSQSHLPFRLLLQYWFSNGELLIDCGCANALALRSNIETVSMKSLFLHNSTLSDTTKSSASMFFTKKLSDYIKADKLTYLVPDWGNDFDLEGIRKSVNLYFDESTPLPKSIAAIFDWQASKQFVTDKIYKNDFVLVLDSFDGGISITPVQAIYHQELNDILPETRGISWERHPTVIVPNRNIHTAMADNLDRDGCQTSAELLHLFGFDGLVSDSGAMSFVKDEHWYHLPSSMREILTQNLEPNILSEKDIGNCLNSINRDCREAHVFILPLAEIIRKPDLRKEYKWLGSAWSPTKGGQTLNRWQKEVEDIALWRDHLPKLSIGIVRDGHFENFYLVKDATVTPQRRKTVDIPVKEEFKLPAGQTHYHFPLRQGEGDKELQFVAYLKSPAFPLNKDTTCKLKMSYTYGADDPYELKFIPLDAKKAGFKSIRVEWRPASEDEAVDLENLPIPDFPVRKEWSDFQRYPNTNGEPSNLLNNIEKELLWLDSIVKHGRVTAEISSEWKKNAKDNKYCFAGGTYLSEFAFDLHNGQDLPQYGDSVQFYKIESNGKFQARCVTFIGQKPQRLFTPKFYFSLFTIWNHGHSPESDVPNHFKNAMSEGVKKMISIIESENMSDTLKEELFFFLCCLHKEAPRIVGSRLLDDVKDKELLRRKDYKNIAFAIGNAELPYQQELLENVIDPIDNEGLTRSIAMEVLSIALWRSKTLINKLTKEKLKVVSNNLYRCLEADLQKVVNDRKGYQALCKHLELLLALLRSREHKDKSFKEILAPNGDLGKKYIALVDRASKIIIDNHIELKSRIDLQIDKPESYHDTPDLLYALRMYLSGDSGANSIVITGVSDTLLEHHSMKDHD